MGIADKFGSDRLLFFYKVCGTMKGALPQFWQSAVYEYERTTL